MKERIRDSFIGAGAALLLFGAVVAALWSPVIQPRLTAAGKSAGEGWLSGVLSSIGVK